MLEISPERMAHYRRLLEEFSIAEERKDDLIRTIGTIMLSFVDRAWGTDPIQILEHNRLKDSFQRVALHDSLSVKLLNSDNAERIDLSLQSEDHGEFKGANTHTKKKRGWRHETRRTEESGHLLPCFQHKTID